MQVNRDKMREMREARGLQDEEAEEEEERKERRRRWWW